MRRVTRDDLSHAARAAAAATHLPAPRGRLPDATRRGATAIDVDSKPVSARPRRSRREYRQTCKYQAMLTLLPAATYAEETAPTWPTWRAVIRAEDHVTHARQLLTVLVSGLEGEGPPADSHTIVTMIVLGRRPADCLAVGDTFTLWRGCDVARGIITRRLFV